MPNLNAGHDHSRAARGIVDISSRELNFFWPYDFDTNGKVKKERAALGPAYIPVSETLNLPNGITLKGDGLASLPDDPIPRDSSLEPKAPRHEYYPKLAS